ncbi:MAG: nucleotide 5'-monophosphate nucleosidase PpnN [gamma proteobacterium symbiont of Bathyaustriella thionipta]|nr:nucleotide 5'-monophosphate nucleosidase PpnN [gamma proteobacterium symbiont of Bathyaustriella thionipta]MCU7949245.1 nucleotide 5'-monophosphate nucleosidase PpnN [gamma proteobacterium symbiont of Bathyaustriella thionipta]MCU7953669.1 nucleotide 5'-monophosphate nucleosidase PpnN [gamma proteobacterium symbiont of Bathyaustriella thionipta]MCU7955833.1 nucleotide 5'-monophosphate nucleosidase PpnN [gamma proteobacterium symbiont of Bathyaustriella thionipta]MCU7966939.1 nucleotide 5'-mo
MNERLTPEGKMDVLSKLEVNILLNASREKFANEFRACSLAVLNTGSTEDSAKAVLEQHPDFKIEVIQQERGIKLQVHNALEQAFVDGTMITGIKEHLFCVLRDIVFVGNEIDTNPRFDLSKTEDITNVIFHILRNAKVLQTDMKPNIAVCWGGHSINRTEYEYTKEVGYQLGLRALNVCTGCGPGAMKGPMKGANIAHAKQRINDGRYIGLTEPGIIAAESPNPIVNELVILPDIEKRLEAFVRMGHGVIIFPGGPGTAEEILYLLGILLHPENKELPFPMILTGPKSSEEYFKKIHHFIEKTLGFEAQQKYKIIIDDPSLVAREMKSMIEDVSDFRRSTSDAYYFNWIMHIDEEFQLPFEPNHENMKNLKLHKDQGIHSLAANLRRAFSGIVAGNVKEDGILAIEKYGKFEISGDEDILSPLDDLLASFVEQQRMKLPGSQYIPCYEIVK